MRSFSKLIFLRRINQIFFLFIFVIFSREFIYSDPLLNLSLFFSIHILPKLFVITLFILIFTILLGRFFCGWFC
ncbi:MAG: 4Fe-4S binding protein, partial [Candidatus Omnitrophota bacterium]